MCGTTIERVSSADIHRNRGRIAYVEAETISWSSRIFFLVPEGEIERGGERLHKAHLSIK